MILGGGGGEFKIANGLLSLYGVSLGGGGGLERYLGGEWECRWSRPRPPRPGIVTCGGRRSWYIPKRVFGMSYV